MNANYETIRQAVQEAVQDVLARNPWVLQAAARPVRAIGTRCPGLMAGMLFSKASARSTPPQQDDGPEYCGGLVPA